MRAHIGLLKLLRILIGVVGRGKVPLVQTVDHLLLSARFNRPMLLLLRISISIYICTFLNDLGLLTGSCDMC